MHTQLDTPLHVIDRSPEESLQESARKDGEMEIPPLKMHCLSLNFFNVNFFFSATDLPVHFVRWFPKLSLLWSLRSSVSFSRQKWKKFLSHSLSICFRSLVPSLSFIFDPTAGQEALNFNGEGTDWERERVIPTWTHLVVVSSTWEMGESKSSSRNRDFNFSCSLAIDAIPISFLTWEKMLNMCERQWTKGNERT